MYLLVMRENEKSNWTPVLGFSISLKEAQKKLMKISLGSNHQYDILLCESIIKRTTAKTVKRKTKG